jgi:hypothetical protein
MKHEMQPDSLVDLKFIMADTGFGKPSYTTGLSPAISPKPNSSTAEQGGYIVTTASSEKSSCPAPMGKVTSKIFFTRKKTPYTSTPAYQVRCMQGTPCPSCFMTDPRRFLMIFLQLR